MPRQAIEPNEEDRRRQSEVLTGLRSERLEAARASGDKAAEKQWELTGVAARIGVSSSTLQRYEGGDTLLPPPYYQAVATVFGLKRADLVMRLWSSDVEPGFDREAAFAEIEALRTVIPPDVFALMDPTRNPNEWDDDDVRFFLRRVRRLAEQYRQRPAAS